MLKKVGGIVLVLVVLAVPLFFIWRAALTEDLSLAVRRSKKFAAVAVLGTADNLNFVLNDDPGVRQADGVLFRGLVRYNDHWLALPEFAQGPGQIEVHGPNETATYTVGNAGRWQDGEPVTADDFVFPYELAASMPPPKLAEWSHSVNYQVQGTSNLSLRYDREAYIEGMPLLPLPSHVLRPLISRNLMAIRTLPFNQKPTSCGPFVVIQNDGKGMLNMLPNTAWALQKPELSRLIFYFLPDAAARLDAVKHERIDVVTDLTAPEVQTLSNGQVPKPGEQAVVGPEMTVAAVATPNVWCLFFNTKDALLKKAAVRRALAQAVDRQACASAVLGPWGRPAASYLAPQHPDYVAAWSDTKADLKSALADLKDQDLEVFALSDNPRGAAIADQVVAAWKAAGVAAHKVVGTRAELVARYSNNQPSAAVIAPLSAGPWVLPSTLFAAERAPSRANRFLGLNYAQWNDPVSEKMLTQIDKATDAARRSADVKRLQVQLADQMPLLPLFSEVEFVAWRNSLQNVKPRGLGEATWNVEEWQWKN